MRVGRTHRGAERAQAPTAAFVRNTDWQNPAAACVRAIAAAAGADGVASFDADGSPRA